MPTILAQRGIHGGMEAWRRGHSAGHGGGPAAALAKL